MSIRKKLILILVTVAVAPMVFVGTLGYYSAKQALEDAKIHALTSICDLQVNKIKSFLEERNKEIVSLHAYPGIKNAIEMLARSRIDGSERAGQHRRRQLDTLLKTLQGNIHFTNLSIASNSGELLYRLTQNEADGYQDNFLSTLTIEPKKPQPDSIRIYDAFPTGRSLNPVAILVASPIQGQGNKPDGWLCVEYDFTPIYESNQAVAGLGESGEILIAKRADNSALFLTPVRDDPNASLKIKMNYEKSHGPPIQAALNGNNGQGLAVDYGGRKVLAAWRYVAFLDLGMVVKMDAAEAFAPATRLRTFFLALIIAVILLSICVAAIVARSFSKPIHRLQKSVEEIGKGDLDHKVGTIARDEIGQLGNAFDQMTGKLKAVTASREELNREIIQRRKAEEDLNETIIDLNERVKELNCLFSISRLVEQRDLSLDEVLQGIVDLIPKAMRYQDIACAKIALNGQEFKTRYFEPSPWQLACNITVAGKTGGRLTVAYLENISAPPEELFLSEEQNLIEVIAERVGKIVERRNSQEALAESEKRFRVLVENSLTGISIVQDNQVIYQNKEQERILGPIPRSYILADTERIHRDDVQKVEAFIRALENKGRQTIETDFRYYSGGDKNHTQSMKWVHCRCLPIELKGAPAILVNLVDMTRAKELESLITIQDKMASLGRVAAGIAHEIRNPLSGINIYLDTLKKLHHRDGSEEKVENILRQIDSASHKIESVIRRVMDFAKPSEPRLTLVDINVPIGEALNLTAVALRKGGILLLKSLSEDLPAVYADRHLIEEMVLNLINNAAEAMRTQKADKIIEVGSKMLEGCIQITVSDSGPGIPPEIRDNIFDPYLTTKSDGTGIGLSLCHRIIVDHGGTLSVGDSELGGAEFRATIPVRAQ